MNLPLSVNPLYNLPHLVDLSLTQIGPSALEALICGVIIRADKRKPGRRGVGWGVH